MQKDRSDIGDVFYFKRQRIHNLFMEAVNYPLVIVTAGAGYGKTSAVNEFVHDIKVETSWIQVSEKDNVGARFWEKCASTVAKINAPFAKAAGKLGFPDTPEKLKQFQALMQIHVKKRQRILVLDDFHEIKDPSLISFMEKCILQSMPPGTSVFLLSRSSPSINIASLVSKGIIYNIGENDLRFTENELAQYFNQMKIPLQPENLREIMQDTDGWAFAINLITRSFQKAPGYSGYVRSAMKNNFFKLMETQIWQNIPESFQTFLIKLSLIDHLSAELINLLAKGDETLIAELEKQNAYIRKDEYINAYHIHHLFLEFIAGKQYLLSEEQKRETFEIAGQWCNKNGFKIDALSYFEKIGDYEAIKEALFIYPWQIPYGIAKFASSILDRAPQEYFNSIEFLAIIHIVSYISQGKWDKAVSLAKHYEEKFLNLKKSDKFKQHALSALYHCWGCLRVLMCTIDDCYDFDKYFEKFSKYFEINEGITKYYRYFQGPWINMAGASRKGSLQDFIDAHTRTLEIFSKLFNGILTGGEELAKGELHFYQGKLHSAETFFIRAIEISNRNKQYENQFLSLSYIMRLSIYQGDYTRAQKTIEEIKKLINEKDFVNRHVYYDIVQCWYYCVLGLPEKVPEWLTENFTPYSHPGFMENFANHLKAMYYYITRNFPPLLSYMQEIKRRESYLFGRVDMLVMEACVYYKLKDKNQAIAVLQEAYETASPNEIIMPFIEFGKDMRTLSSAAIKDSKCKIPKAWLENINRKSASYAKHQVHIVSTYKKMNLVQEGVALSTREKEVLLDLSRSLSRAEIAVSRNLSVNTVKMVISNIYMKLGAESLAEAIRIATERKII